MSVICACLPTLRKPFSDLMHRLGLPHTSMGNSSYPLGDLPSSSNARSKRRTVWDPSNKEWHEDKKNYHSAADNSRRPSLSNESVMGIVITTDVEIMRSSGEGSARVSSDPQEEHGSGRRVNVT